MIAAFLVYSSFSSLDKKEKIEPVHVYSLADMPMRTPKIAGSNLST